MTVSILTVDDEADIAELFRQHFRREVRRVSMHCISRIRLRKRCRCWPTASGRS
jgi:hypothetical protein